MLAQIPLTLNSGTWLPQPKTLPSFTLTDLRGQRFGLRELGGHPTLVYFGFTYCPDICPTTLAVLRDALPGLRAALPSLQVVFVTVDPERDTPATLKVYLAAFDRHFQGLYGSPAELAPLLEGLGAVAERHNLPGGSYTMDHSATLFLVDTRGRLAAVFSPPITAAGLRADLLQLAHAAVL